VRLAVDAERAAVRVEHDRGVVVDALRALLEQRRDDRDLALRGELRERLAALARDRLGEIELRGVLALAEVAGAEELGQAGDLRALTRRRVDALERAREVLRRVLFHPHLDQRDSQR
jgi:hypothetical protein